MYNYLTTKLLYKTSQLNSALAMMSDATILKLVSVLEIALASLAGGCLPFLYLRSKRSEHSGEIIVELDSQPMFFILKALSCGIIIGVALLHLLPDADELLSEHFDYPVCFAAAGLGIVLCLICEQLAMWIVSTSDSDHSVHGLSLEVDSNDVNHPLLVEDRTNSRSRRVSSSGALVPGRTISVSGRPIRFESNCEIGMAVRFLASANDTKTLLKAYVLEGAIAVHSVIMGISLGALEDDDISEIRVLMVAYGIHQTLEGISLGCAISAADLSTGKVAGLLGFFSGTLPVGILIGILIASSTESRSGEIIAGFANGIASGILIYVSMVEMMADEFSNKVVVNDYALKAKIILAIVIGIGVMSLLAVWA